ncbi:Zn(2)-C6 fungal-type DNA-binding domain protein [Moelleriella libera RCEF 2490]|uniref:Zn(2)-C6 fungal-type DNA-binding domain protein n=1 Tax=Moelleriella libera RCEF 2490 TaxID=1081109 RepID=A0A167XVJ4_9HYPO|nr:Zn(2)-C6 fungal-type DNA-binding domain protein [Moelleriella libera RCEF 2490]
MSNPNPAPAPAAFSQTYPSYHESRLPTVGPSRQTQRGRSISSRSDTPRPDTPRGLLPVGATPQEAAQNADAAFQVEHVDFDHNSWSAEQSYPPSHAIEDASLGNDGANPGVREFGSQFESQSNDWCSSHEGDATLDAEPGIFRGSYSDLLSQPWADAEPGIFRGSYSDLLSASSFAENSFAHHDPETSLDLSQYDSHPDGDYFDFDDGQSLFEQESAVETLYNTSLSSTADLSTPGEANLDMWQHAYAPSSSSTALSQSVDIGLSQPTSAMAAAADPQLKPVTENFAATLQPQTERAPRGKRTKPLSPKTGQRALHNRRNRLVCVNCHERKTGCIRENGDNKPCAQCDKKGLPCQRWKPCAPLDWPEDRNGSLGTHGRQRDEM